VKSVQTKSEGYSSRKPSQPVIDVTPLTNIHTIVALALRLTAVNFLVRMLVEISTPLLISAGIYQRPVDQAPMTIAWALVGALFLGGLLLWTLAVPLARLVARGVPGDISFDNLTLADCYSLSFAGMGVVYIVSHSAGAWNWTMYFLRWLFHRQYAPWSNPGRGYEIMGIFIPFTAGILLVLMRKKLAHMLAGSSAHGPVSFKR
jgi:hypothetical protein